ncbi:MAG: hypothetical protein IPO09_22045 [Anaeromyxobacter sp.]|nr:hypothetical protein [Anaeromyxobacter sp.]MBL0274554.1 hypothetical protein [Anaeromyxobacter sp.]
MSSWNCRHELNGICKKVALAYCRPGMKGCVLVGKVTFQDGVIPNPVWPPKADGSPGGPAREDDQER